MVEFSQIPDFLNKKSKIRDFSEDYEFEVSQSTKKTKRVRFDNLLDCKPNIIEEDLKRENVNNLPSSSKQDAMLQTETLIRYNKYTQTADTNHCDCLKKQQMHLSLTSHSLFKRPNQPALKIGLCVPKGKKRKVVYPAEAG